MYPNLEAEIARHRLTNAICAQSLDMTEKSFSNKRTGKTDFTLQEVKNIQKRLFNGCTLEYLFATDLEQD